MGTTCWNSNPVFYDSQAHVVLIIRAIGEESSLKEQFLWEKRHGGRKFCITFWEGAVKSIQKRSEDRVDYGDNTGQVLVMKSECFCL